MIDGEIKDNSRENVDSVRHVPKYDVDAVNRAIEKSNRDPSFLNYAIKLLEGMQFPAFKYNIIEYVAKATLDQEVLALFESLNGYIKFEDSYHVRKALEENSPKSKKMYQMSDQTRHEPQVLPTDTTLDDRTADKSKTKSNEAQTVYRNEERKDYPEVTPTAMRHFICSKCGKPFQNQDDLAQHKIFEREEHE